MMLYPTVVLVPQWVLDRINQAADQPMPAHLFTDEMRANGWTREMVIGGMMFTTALRAGMEQT